MLDQLSQLPPDPILGLMGRFNEDTNPAKIDLGVGVFRNEQGVTPILDAVKQAESRLLQEESSKAYIGPAGNQRFNALVLELILGAGHPALTERRAVAMQTPGGCGALRVAAELIMKATPDTRIWVSDPTWGNHVPLLGDSRLHIETYPYYDYERHGIKFDSMMDCLQSRTRPGDLVLLHASCHNPCGADLSADQWRQVAALCSQRGLVPFVDMAYQGFGDGIDEDSAGLRLLAEKLPEVLFAYSCSKNFGLYRERTGAVGAVVSNHAAVPVVASQIMRIVRGIYSMPPSHGAAIVETILSDPAMTRSWQAELTAMRQRISATREELVSRMDSAGFTGRFDFITREKGMFSFLGLSQQQVNRLIEEHSVYMVDSSRINVAGLNQDNMGRFCDALATVLEHTPG